MNTYKENSTCLDVRRLALDEWVAKQVGERVEGSSISSDASFRRYFRYTLKHRSVVAMDAPTDLEDCRPFVNVAHMLAGCGVCVPQIFAQDFDQGFLLLSDLGKQTYLDVINSDNANRLFDDAISSLIRFQQLTTTQALPRYDAGFLRRELELFPTWYLQVYLGLDIDAPLRRLLDQLFDQLIEQILSQKTVFMHRDYMPRNLMISTPNPGVLDFQDAVLGPISYDAISLFKDAFISWPENNTQQWLQRYWSAAQLVDLPVPAVFAQFQKDCDFTGAQRHLKIMGIFARIYHRDGTLRYVEDTPRFITYLQTVADRRPELSLLKQLLNKLVPLVGAL